MCRSSRRNDPDASSSARTRRTPSHDSCILGQGLHTPVRPSVGRRRAAFVWDCCTPHLMCVWHVGTRPARSFISDLRPRLRPSVLRAVWGRAACARSRARRTDTSVDHNCRARAVIDPTATQHRSSHSGSSHRNAQPTSFQSHVHVAKRRALTRYIRVVRGSMCMHSHCNWRKKFESFQLSETRKWMDEEGAVCLSFFLSSVLP